jgi:signal peptidase I
MTVPVRPSPAARPPAAWRQSWGALAVSAAARCVLSVLVLLVIASVVPVAFGWQTSVVMSGSMEPTLRPGDVAVVRPVDAADVEPGQIVLVDDPDHPGQLRMHRVLSADETSVQLQGDANPRPDSSRVDRSAVRGVGAFRLPGLGLPALWVAQGRVLPLLATGVGLATLLGAALVRRGATGEVGDAPRRTARGGAVLGAAVVVLAVPLAASGAEARFTATTTSPGNSFATADYWSCAAAEGSSGANAAQRFTLAETAGPTAANTGSTATAGNGTYSSSGVSYGATGPECGTDDRSAVTLDGTAGFLYTTTALTNPTTFSEQIWFRTTTTRGGKIIGFGNGTAGAKSSSYDRHLYMTNTGQLVFGVYNGASQAVTSAAAFNDGTWHLATATFSAATGMRLYVDGKAVGANPAVTTAENITGYWRIGYDNLGSWPSAPSSAYFAGSLAHATIYDSVLSAEEVADQFRAVGPWTCAAPSTAATTATVAYPLQETAGPTAANGGTAGAAANGTYSGGITYGAMGPSCGSTVTSAVVLNGSSGMISAGQAVTNPQTFSVQLWFATTTSRGGRLIGLGSSLTGLSTHYDRHVYMTNSGQLVFGVYNGSNTVVSSPGSYNDGRWHLVTATFSAGTGMRLYVDGAVVAAGTAATSAENFTGYWRIGYDNLAGWASAPASPWFAGSLAQVSVYGTVLSDAAVAAQYVTGP